MATDVVVDKSGLATGVLASSAATALVASSTSSGPVLAIATTAFPAMYYDSPTEQMVLGFTASADDSVTAAITAGAAYFKVTSLDVCNWETVVVPPPPPKTGTGTVPDMKLAATATLATAAPLAAATAFTPEKPIAETGPRVLSQPAATSNGTTPLAVKLGQFVRLWVTCDVPKGSALPVGAFTGTAAVTGAKTSQTAALSSSYLGSLIGSVTVTPTSAAPGQPILVQILDSSGKPASDARVTYQIQSAIASARYLQYPTIGARTLIATATYGALSETAQATATVVGTPLAFRSSLTTPVVTEVPMIQAAWVPGQPYAATFTLGTTDGLRREMAAALAATATPATATATAATATTTTATAATTLVKPAITAAPLAKAAVATVPVAVQASTLTAPVDVLGTAFTKAVAAVPAASVVKAEPLTSTVDGLTFSASGLLAPIGVATPTAAATTSYQWSFGDGQTLTTTAPTSSHDYFAAMKGTDLTRAFDVTCTVVHDNITVQRTLVLHSSYGLARRMGVVVPPVTGTPYATFQQVAYTASMIVHNLEPAAITLTQQALLPISDTTTATLPAPAFTTMKTPIAIAANSSSAIGTYVPLAALTLAGAFVNGFVVYYSGTIAIGGATLPVRFSYTFRIPLSDSGAAGATLPVAMTATSWDLTSALSSVTAIATKSGSAVSAAGAQTVDPATNTVAIPLTGDPSAFSTVLTARSAIEAGATSIALETGALTANGAALRLTTLKPSPKPPSPPPPSPDSGTYNPSSPPAVAAGNVCYPDDISDADAATASSQQLVCQLTGQTETMTIPAAFQNAQQGDIILSPAPVTGGDLIAAMFKALQPPQHHGHSGMMTLNFYEITHCTASVDRISDNTNNDALGIPTSLNNSMLEYAWPGSITQSIDDTITSVNMKSPEGKLYSIDGFNTTVEGDDFSMTYPMVVKPLPEHEATVRPTLRQAADTARSKGARYDANGNQTQAGGCYYCFYCYTKPQESAGFTDAAPAAAGWAQGMSPAVCSSFVWLSLKENGVPLVSTAATETLADFSPLQIEAGAAVGPSTLDGLIYYPQAEREAAAQGLYQMFMDQALSKEYGLGTLPGVNDTIAGPLADQLLNMFAFGDPSMVGSSAWQTPGDGNAVSPDNIMLWNPPYYGYAEPLQFLPQHVEQYTVSKWVKVVTWGSITGKVTNNGAPVANAHVWVYLPGGDTYTAADGSYTLDHVGIGPYDLTVQAVIGGEEYNNGGGTPVTLTAANPNIVENIALQATPVDYRLVTASYSMSCDHGDGNPFNKHGVLTTNTYTQTVTVNPGQVTNSLGYTYDYNGGGYFHIDYQFSVALLEDNSISFTITGKMYDDGSNSVQDQYEIGPYTIDVGGTWSGTMTMEQSSTGYHNGPAILTFSLTNGQQTG